jgi:hypothetical protein
MIGKRSNKITTTHGGIVPIVKTLRDLRVPQLIRGCFDKRNARAEYGYEDVFISWILSQMCGATRLAQIMQKKKWKNILPDLKIPSHDTLGRVMKSLATKNKTAKSPGHTKIPGTYTVNENMTLNKMLVKITKAVNALSENRVYTLDIDAMFINTTRKDAARKAAKSGVTDHARIGFNPMICLIGDLPVFISMRSGDANSRLHIHKCLSDCLEVLDDSNIRIGRVISDAAGYNKDAMKMLDDRGIIFNMRFPHQKMMKTFNRQLSRQDGWRETRIGTANFRWDCEIADIPYTMHKLYQPWRVVAIRVPTDETAEELYGKEELKKRKKLKEEFAKQRLKEGAKLYDGGKWKEIDGYLYKFIITNDFAKGSEDLVVEYNRRGNSERKFSFMKRDFGWRMPPFCLMKHNTVFLIATALANNVFRGMVRKFINNVPDMKFSQRLAEFIKNFILVACEYVNGEYDFSNTDIAFEEIMV